MSAVISVNPPRNTSHRWLLAAVTLSALLHIAVLFLGRTVRSPSHVHARQPLEVNLEVRLQAPSVQPGKAMTADHEPSVQAKPARPQEPDTAAASNTPARSGIDWQEEIRQVTGKQDSSRSLYSPPPLESGGLRGKDERAFSIPGLEEAFGPLPRARRICGYEMTIDLGYYQITMPVAYGCTPEEKEEQMRGRQPPP